MLPAYKSTIAYDIIETNQRFQMDDDPEFNNLKIAITHDALYEYGGAEMVLWQLLKMFPRADLYTPVYKPTKAQRAFWAEAKNHSIRTSFINYLPKSTRLYKLLILFQIRFFENLDLGKYDLVISSSSAFAKYLNTKTPHVAYIHTPPRFIWGFESTTFDNLPRILQKLFRPLIKRLKKKDKKYARKAKLILTNSKNIAAKIKTVYGKDAKVIYPPVAIRSILQAPEFGKQDFFLTIGRLYAYKHIEKIVKAFESRTETLKIIGDGPQRKSLEKMHKGNVELLGFVDEDRKIELLKQARGFIFAAEEDFGIVLVEALAAGTPVIAYKAGGALEIIKPNKNGLLFEVQEPQAITKAIDKFQEIKFDREKTIESSKQFSIENFQRKLQKEIKKII